MHRVFEQLAVLFVLMFILAACGSNSTPSSVSASPTTEATHVNPAVPLRGNYYYKFENGNTEGWYSEQHMNVSVTRSVHHEGSSSLSVESHVMAKYASVAAVPFDRFPPEGLATPGPYVLAKSTTITCWVNVSRAVYNQDQPSPEILLSLFDTKFRNYQTVSRHSPARATRSNPLCLLSE